MVALEESMMDAIKSRFKQVLDDYSKADDVEKFKLQWIKGLPTNKAAVAAGAHIN